MTTTLLLRLFRQVFSKCSIGLLCTLSLLSFMSNAAETKLLAFVSDRSAASIVSGAHLFLEKQKTRINSSNSSVTIRSVSQLNRLTNIEIQQLINQHNGLIIAGVFGESVERLLALKYQPNQTRLMLNTDRRLMTLHHDVQGGNIALLSKKQLQQLMAPFNKDNYLKALVDKQKQWLQFSYWLQARAYWQNRGKENLGGLFTWLKIITESKLQSTVQSKVQLNTEKNQRLLTQAKAILPLQPIRFYLEEQLLSVVELNNQIAINKSKPVVFIIDHDTGEQPGQWQLHQQLCQSQWQCISVLAGWGKPSEQAIDTILNSKSTQPLALITLQDFVIGGGEGRESVTQKFKALNIPVFKGIRVTELSELEYKLSPTGLPSDSVHYRVAMPELQGVSQPHILALASSETLDKATGASISMSEVQTAEVARLQARVDAWLALKTLDNVNKKIAIVYYNHPPGRHNIGADNLDVQQSLWHILQTLKAQGYDLGPEADFPKSADELLDILQLKAVNLPQDADALNKMSALINTMSASEYQTYFDTLPDIVKAEMIEGPLGYLHARVKFYLFEQGKEQLKKLPIVERSSVLTALLNNVENTSVDLHHALDGIRHKGRARALDLLAQLTDEYKKTIALTLNNTSISVEQFNNAEALKNAIIAMQIEGIRGWGNIPGKTMVWNNEILLPGVQFGNIFLGPQPPRGWELNEELLHANMTFPPPHQYLAFYYHLRDVFKANAIVHLGRHSTYEFLPKRAVGLSASDYPSLIIENIPSIYPYIVDGVGEGIQAKRRGIAVMLDHLTPPLATTELYDGLLQLRQLIESAEAAANSDTKKKAIKALRHKIKVLNLTDELVASMDEELQVRGIGFGEVGDDFLLHEVGHYLTKLQEDFMPLGLHVYGKEWQPNAIEIMMESIEKGELDFDTTERNQIRENLTKSPKSEMTAFVNALNGGFVAPGKGNDPIRTPDALPTGRNFYALDGSLIPSQLGFATGQKLASKAREENPVVDKTHKEAVILWASDAVRDEGAMIAFGMDMLGVKPVWNRRGILKSLTLIPLDNERTQRRDIVFTTSGLFRDLYAQQLAWLDRSVLLALAASKNSIERDHPALIMALHAALQPVAHIIENEKHAFNEPLASNMVASNWVREAQALLRSNSNISPKLLGRQASYRIFGTAPGAYGAGINRLAERSGAWQERKELGNAYIKRMSHAYGVPNENIVMGSNVQSLFRDQLAHVNNTYLGRASNLYGLIDNNDAYDYLGGLNLAIETISGKQPESFVISHANSKNMSIDPLQTALLSELRGRFLNRQWIQPLMKQGYAGARTMGSEFIENLWGWQATSPEIIRSWVWEDLKAIYIDDSLEIGLDEFLQQKHNIHVQSNILAVMLVAIEKGFWEADEQTQQELAEKFAENIIEHGIPGSGHTHANHPIYDFIKPMLSAEVTAQLAQVLAAANYTPVGDVASGVQHIQEISTELQTQKLNDSTSTSSQKSDTENDSEQNTEQSADKQYLLFGVIIVILLLVVSGYVRSRRQLSKVGS